MTTDIVFYTNPQSRGRIARWMLEEVGATYETQVMEYDTTMKSAEYLAINPMGKVPAIRHGDTVVTECAAICAYLADAFPEAGLAPPTDRRGPYYRWLFFAAGPLEAALTNHAMKFEPTGRQQMMSGYGSYEKVLDVLEEAVSANSYIAGENFSAADVYVGSHIGWGMQFGTMEKRQAFIDYWDRLSAREARQRATELDNALMEQKAE